MAHHRSIRELMTTKPTTVEPSRTVVDAARVMKQEDVGPVPVVENGDRLAGIVTDRDIVVRAIADGRDPDTPVGGVATRDARTVTPDSDVDEAIKIVREDDVRRVPVVDDGRPVGIVSIGDLAIERDPSSALADMSTSEPNN
jgi:CBS domain-containing protein